ncbi:hypothetical protein KR222_007991 [Zaprionus bogoriensis]|nr:hypothetical protein KR222_007991 [Zaprionus bogoriensis]
MHSNNDLSTSHLRSPSQVSIYNYPDHLNPFYEEDNHNRLRFWKTSTKVNSNRRRSFSLENFRELWTLKSFSLKKKSSTLGIQKTSESPPTLRRISNTGSHYQSFRHTADPTYLNRGPLRSSIHDINTTSMVSSLKQ